jgi:hypothetical protein
MKGVGLIAVQAESRRMDDAEKDSLYLLNINNFNLLKGVERTSRTTF